MDILTNEIEHTATFQQSAISDADLLNVISDGQKYFGKNKDKCEKNENENLHLL